MRPLASLGARRDLPACLRPAATLSRDERLAWALGGIRLREAELPGSVLERLFRASDGRLKVLEWLPPGTDATSSA